MAHEHTKAGAAALGAIGIATVAAIAGAPLAADYLGSDPTVYQGLVIATLAPVLYGILRHFGIEIRGG